MVVRLVDPLQREVFVRLGIAEVRRPDLREDEVIVYVTPEQLVDIQNEPNVALVYPASLELIQGVPVQSCTPPEPDMVGQYVMNVGRGWGSGAKLTYSVQSFTEKLGREQTLSMLQRALSEWGKQ